MLKVLLSRWTLYNAHKLSIFLVLQYYGDKRMNHSGPHLIMICILMKQYLKFIVIKTRQFYYKSNERRKKTSPRSSMAKTMKILNEMCFSHDNKYNVMYVNYLYYYNYLAQHFNRGSFPHRCSFITLFGAIVDT